MYRKDYGILTGRYRASGREGVPIGLSGKGNTISLQSDSVFRHFLVLGKTGSGKSSFMLNLASQILKLQLGSAIVLDPHGKLATDLALEFPDKALIVTSGHSDDGKSRVSTGIRTILKSNPDEIDQVTSILRDQFSRNLALSQGTWGPRLETVFTVLMKEIMNRREVHSLSGILSYLVNQNKIKAMLRDVQDENVREFLRMQISDWRNWNSYISSSVNKLLPVATDPKIRGMIDPDDDCINIRDAIRAGSLIIPEIWTTGTENVSVVSSLFLSRIWLEARKEQFENHVFVFIDEAQSFPEYILDMILREGRKFGITLILATQFLPVNSDLWKKTVLGNAGNYAVFALTSSDASHVAASIVRLQAREKIVDAIQTQPPYNFLFWQTGDDGLQGPAKIVVPKPHPPKASDYSEIRRNCMLIHGKTTTPESLNKPSETDLHAYILELTVGYFSGRGFICDVAVKKGNTIPDATVNVEGTEFIVEVEVSDLANFRRVTEKILNYQGRRMIFVTIGELCNHLYSGILQACRDSGPERELSRSVVGMLGNITILGVESGSLFIYTPSRHLPVRKDYLQKGTFELSVAVGKTHRQGQILLDYMIKKKAFRVSAAEIRSIFSNTFTESLTSLGMESLTIYDVLAFKEIE
ncbi:MAG TPA: DUF87 domain-containing protein [Thermoplasmataceae archaeon]|nr:DUF87 domain-containing protein [Thermoplasmataceae archaeon]